MRRALLLLVVLSGACSSSTAAPDAGGAADGPLADAAAPGAEAGPLDVPPGDEAGAPVTCGNDAAAPPFATWPLPDPATTGAPGSQRYDTSAPDVVVDQVTHLVWQRQLDPRTYDWAGAQAACRCLHLAGQQDWRLPTRIELISIVDSTRHAPSIDGAAFPDTPVEWFWTATALADDPTFAWYLYFDTGFSNFIEKSSTYRVRCVRSPAAAPVSLDRYQAAGGTVRDRFTGLTWQQSPDPAVRAWDDSRAYCAALPLAGGGWRLPSMKELQSLVDDRQASPAIDPVAFPDSPGDPFWSGTPVAGTTASAWRVSFEHGYTYDALVTYQYRARCVR
jgi:hypothetical protein